MPPGEYLPDRTEGITRVEDLPRPSVEHRSRSYRRRPRPRRGRSCYRGTLGRRVLRDRGCWRRDRPRDLHVVYSKHRRGACDLCFSAALSDLAPPGSHYTRRVIARAVRLVAEDGLPYRTAPWHLWRDHRVFVPLATAPNRVGAAGGKRRGAG
jgi:hypothetical protein